ncbi:hypothetical protein ACH4U7_51340 [Streptomyces sp. NPDC020845]|uniref:hypothetical protein n=1 Tax=Streptomyces sp. NPDC020845 TaxID=3365096 RepID=UPI0037880FBA
MASIREHRGKCQEDLHTAGLEAVPKLLVKCAPRSRMGNLIVSEWLPRCMRQLRAWQAIQAHGHVSAAETASAWCARFAAHSEIPLGVFLLNGGPEAISAAR